MRRDAIVALGMVLACGARTGLLAPDNDAGVHHDAGDASTCGTHCSADLHEVLDCNGKVVQVCDENQGCDGTGCSEACLAAQAHMSTVGCEYYAIDPDVIADGIGACFAAFVANTWTSPVTVGVDRGGTTFDPALFARVPSGAGQSITYAPLTNGQLQPGQVAILFLARSGATLTSCPSGITPAVTVEDAAIHGTGLGHAFHITATAPVAAYAIFPYGGGPSAVTAATLLLPPSTFEDNFVATAPFDPDVLVPYANATLSFVATQDDTAITIDPTNAIIPGLDVKGTMTHVPITYTLSAGQELQITQHDDLTGSMIQATKPIAVFAGATCMNIGTSDNACDVGHQQLPAIRALGSEYVGVRYRNRNNIEEIVPWRFVGVVDGTTLTFEPHIDGAPTALARGQLATLWSPGPFVVTSQDASHPFYMSAHMTSADSPFSGGDLGRGDPEFVNVIPPKEYLANYTFFTDPTYPETNLVVIRESSDDVTLDCAGKLGSWQSIGSSKYQFTRIDLVRHNFDPQGSCDNGLHTMSSTSPFGVTVWAWGSEETGSWSKYVSYAYPAGASIVPINDVVVPVN